MSVAEPTPNIDPNATPVKAPPPPAEPPTPTVESHAETGTTLLFYPGDNLDADLVVGYARSAGHDIIGLPDQLDAQTWRIQVATPPAEPAPPPAEPAPTTTTKKG